MRILQRLARTLSGIVVPLLGVVLFTVCFGTPLSAQVVITPATIPNGVVGTAYSQALTATGGTAPYTWSMVGSFPAGLSLSAAGVISGTPMTAGATSLTVQAQGSGGTPLTGTRMYPITIIPALSITTTALAGGVRTTAYSQTLAAAGGVMPYVWSLSVGSLPAGLTLNPATGVISGTPTTAATTPFTVQLRDTGLPVQTVTKALSITIIAAAPSITTATLPGGTAGTAYSQTVAATGGTTPYAWSLSAGSLPAGLTLNASTGVISGTPTAAGMVSFTVQVRDSSSPALTATRALSITIAAAPALSVSTTSLPGGTVGVVYSQTLAATGGVTPYAWSVTTGTLPPGLSLAPATGVISGTPTGNSATFTVEVRDSGSPAQTANRALSITIAPPIPPLSITTTALAGGNVGAAYSQTVAATGGTTPYAWSVSTGSLPAGLTLNAASGVISGTPTATGSSTFTVQARDASSPVQTATRELSIAIAPSIPALAITTNSLPGGIVGAAYSQTLIASGGVPPYNWTVSVGSLPGGLSLNAATGVISGTATTAGAFSFTIRVGDSGAPSTASKVLSINIDPVLVLGTASALPTGIVGTDYTQTLSATGGVSPYTWSLVAGSLPAGMTLTPAGVLGGTPSASGSFNFSIQVRDAGSTPQSITRAFALIILGQLTITTTSPLRPGVPGSSYFQALEATGGSAPYVWSMASGQLPPGLAFSRTGELSGTPTTIGTFNFAVGLADSASRQVSKAFSVVIQSALTITTTSPLPAALVGVPYSQQLEASNAAVLTWSLTSGSLPGGINLSTGGVLSGTAAAEGTFDFVVQVSGGTPVQMATQAFRLAVNSIPTITTATLVSGTQNVAYSQQLQAAGGAPPYVWSAGSVLPAGLTLSAAGLLSGTPTAAASTTVIINLMDSRSVTSSKTFTLSVLPPIDTLAVTNIPGTLKPAQQTALGLSLRSAYPSALSGQLRLTFTPNAAVASDDPMVQFSTGSRTVNFDIPANSTSAVFSSPILLLLTGTVAGTIQMTASIQNGPANVLVGVTEILPAAPQINNVAASQTATGIVIRVTGYSPGRSITSVTFGFDLRTTSGVQRVNLTRSVEADFAGWYQNPASVPFGSAFVFAQSFNVQGDGSGIETVTVTMTNAQGTTIAGAVPVVRQ